MSLIRCYWLLFLISLISNFSLMAMDQDEKVGSKHKRSYSQHRASNRINQNKNSQNKRKQKQPRKKNKIASDPAIEISPVKAKSLGGAGREIRNYAVYALVAIKGDDRSFIPAHSQRFNCAEALSGKKITKHNLNKFLLEIDKRADQWIERSNLLFNRIVYVGIAESMTKRFPGHKSDLKDVKVFENDDGDDQHVLNDISADFDDSKGIQTRWNASKKVQVVTELGLYGYRTYMTSLAYNCPHKYLPTIEVLLGSKFRVTQKASAIIGNHAAWENMERFQEYKQKKNLTESSVFSNLAKQFFTKLLSL